MTKTEIKNLIREVTERMNGNTEVKWFVNTNTANTITIGNDYIGSGDAFKIQYKKDTTFDTEDEYITVSTLPDNTAFTFILIGNTRWDDTNNKADGMEKAVKAVAHYFNYCY